MFGFLFVFLDFRLNGHDLIPDALGFGIAAVGLAFAPSIRLLQWAQAAAWAACLAAVLGLAFPDTDSASTVHDWLGRADAVAQFALVLLLCLGVRKLAGADSPLGRRAGKLAVIMFVAPVIGYLLVLFSAEGSPTAGPLIVVVVGALIVNALFLAFLFTADRQLASSPAS